MNIKKAWLALWDKLEPAESAEKHESPVEVLWGDPIVTIYHAKSKSFYDGAAAFFDGESIVWRTMEKPAWHGKWYRSCADAFEHGGTDVEVTSRTALLVDGKAYLFEGSAGIEIEPKPKVPKGKRKAV